MTPLCCIHLILINYAAKENTFRTIDILLDLMDNCFDLGFDSSSLNIILTPTFLFSFLLVSINQMKCYVINLKRAVERKLYMLTQLQSLSQDFEFVEGIDWKDIDPSCHYKTSRHLKIKNSYRTLTLGQMGCNLSHRKILSNLLDSSERIIAVLEDDVRLSIDFPEVLDALENTSKKFDIVFLGSRFSEKGLVDLMPLNNNYNFALGHRIDGGAWGYVITRAAAREFLRILPDVTGPIDDALHAYFLHDLKTYTLKPQIVFHEDQAKRYSYNEEKKFEGRKFNEELIRLLPKLYELTFRKVKIRSRIRTEKL